MHIEQTNSAKQAPCLVSRKDKWVGEEAEAVVRTRQAMKLHTGLPSSGRGGGGGGGGEGGAQRRRREETQRGGSALAKGTRIERNATTAESAGAGALWPTYLLKDVVKRLLVPICSHGITVQFLKRVVKNRVKL